MGEKKTFLYSVWVMVPLSHMTEEEIRADIKDGIEDAVRRGKN